MWKVWTMSGLILEGNSPPGIMSNGHAPSLKGDGPGFPATFQGASGSSRHHSCQERRNKSYRILYIPSFNLREVNWKLEVSIYLNMRVPSVGSSQEHKWQTLWELKPLNNRHALIPFQPNTHTPNPENAFSQGALRRNGQSPFVAIQIKRTVLLPTSKQRGSWLQGRLVVKRLVLEQHIRIY